MATATLTWTLPTTRADGTPLAPSEIAQTNVFDGGASIINVTAPANTTTFAVQPGTHSFTAIVQDTQGNLSAASNVASLVVPSPSPPAAITDLAAVLHP